MILVPLCDQCRIERGGGVIRHVATDPVAIPGCGGDCFDRIDDLGHVVGHDLADRIDQPHRAVRRGVVETSGKHAMRLRESRVSGTPTETDA